MEKVIHYSIKKLTFVLRHRIEQDETLSGMPAVLTVLWISKFICFINSVMKQKPSQRQKLKVFCQASSIKDEGFFWRYSFSTLVNLSNAPNSTSWFHAFKIFLISCINFIKQQGYIHLLLRRVCNINYNIVLFSSQRIDKDALSHFVLKRFSYLGSPELIDVPDYAINTNMLLLPTKPNETECLIISSIQEHLSMAMKEAQTLEPQAENDALVSEAVLKQAIADLDSFFPVCRFLRRSILQQSLSFFTKKKQPQGRVVVIDSAGQILRNSNLFALCCLLDFEACGLQHGGYYGELNAINLAVEIENAAYSLGFAGWGFNLGKYYSLRKRHTPKNVFGFNHVSGVLYPQSIDANLLEAFPNDKNSVESVEANKNLIADTVLGLDVPAWVKPHPKSSNQDRLNVSVKALKRGGSKPGIDKETVKLVVFDSPGQTLLFDCIDYGVNFIFCFNLKHFNLTKPGKKFYLKLAAQNRFVDSGSPNLSKKLDKAIKTLLIN